MLLTVFGAGVDTNNDPAEKSIAEVIAEVNVLEDLRTEILVVTW